MKYLIYIVITIVFLFTAGCLNDNKNNAVIPTQITVQNTSTIATPVIIPTPATTQISIPSKSNNGGFISINTNKNVYQLGDTVEIYGFNPNFFKTYLFVTGPGLPPYGVPFYYSTVERYNKIRVRTGYPGSFSISDTDVKHEHTWSIKWNLFTDLTEVDYYYCDPSIQSSWKDSTPYRGKRCMSNQTSSRLPLNLTEGEYTIYALNAPIDGIVLEKGDLGSISLKEFYIDSFDDIVYNSTKIYIKKS